MGFPGWTYKKMWISNGFLRNMIYISLVFHIYVSLQDGIDIDDDLLRRSYGVANVWDQPFPLLGHPTGQYLADLAFLTYHDDPYLRSESSLDVCFTGDPFKVVHPRHLKSSSLLFFAGHIQSNDRWKNMILILVGGFNPSEKYESQLGWSFPIYGKLKNVPNHQPGYAHMFPDPWHDSPTIPWDIQQILHSHIDIDISPDEISKNDIKKPISLIIIPWDIPHSIHSITGYTILIFNIFDIPYFYVHIQQIFNYSRDSPAIPL